jgi:carboxypeptidase C (cathepsin A)
MIRPMMISPFHKPLVFLALALLHPLSAQEKPADDAKKPPAKEDAAKAAEPISIQSKVTIAGQSVPYTTTTGKLILRDDKGKAKASVFHITYTRDGIEDTKDRPVMFAFNGGPGSSSVWLHLGILGPKRIDFPGDGTQPVDPPARLIDNDMSMLDVCDLVFIDPVSTGYSRVEKDGNPQDFHGLQQDIDSVGDFIRIWITENKRWASPKYLCGESYGGVRAAGLAQHLQDRYGMSLNGVILLSSLLDYRTLVGSQGSHLNYQVFLPTFATTAHFHKKVEGDREALIKEAREFAFGEYAVALLKGSEITREETEAVAAKLSKLTGIPAETWIRKSLRLDSFEFRKELLRDEGKVVGRFDARVAWSTTAPNATSAEYDPSYSLAIGAFSTAMLSYLGNDLGWKEDQPYEVLTGKVHPWSYGSDNRIVNLTARLTTALRDNPKLRVLVMGAHADLATPPEGVPYSLRQEVDLPGDLRGQFTFTYYDAGHMFYINPPDLVKSRADLLEFLKPQ